jgi:hypothetical protein
VRTILPLIALLLSVAPTSASAEPSYPWLDSTGAIALDTRFAPPDGFERVRVNDGTYARWLRSLPTEPTRTTVLAHDGEQLDRPAAAIVRMDVGRGDLQQCADSTIRLHAEYQWASSRATDAAYHFTSGDRSTWVDWRDGERFEVLGATVKRVRGESSRGHAAYRVWLQHLFRYAGTRSLRLDTNPVAESDPLLAGDLFLEPGSPGHVVMILDVAENASGVRVALLGQGFMPAEEFHVLRSKRARAGVWFTLPGPGEAIDTPSWRPFQRADVRRFRD